MFDVSVFRAEDLRAEEWLRFESSGSYSYSCPCSFFSWQGTQ